MSKELALHVLNDHARTCPGCMFGAVICSCGRSGALVCTACHTFLLIASPPGDECEHAAALLWPEP
jgi:hypothetical protein